MSQVRFRSATAALAGILIAIGGCTESPSSPVQPQFVLRGAHARFSVSGTASAVIDQRGGSLTSPAGDRIVFPAGALSAPTEISITSDPTYVGVSLQPHGLRFPVGHEPTLLLNTAESNASQYGTRSVVYVDDDKTIEEVLPTANGTNSAGAQLHHFSGYLYTGS